MFLRCNCASHEIRNCHEPVGGDGDCLSLQWPGKMTLAIAIAEDETSNADKLTSQYKKSFLKEIANSSLKPHWAS